MVLVCFKAARVAPPALIVPATYSLAHFRLAPSLLRSLSLSSVPFFQHNGAGAQCRNSGRLLFCSSERELSPRIHGRIRDPPRSHSLCLPDYCQENGRARFQIYSMDSTPTCASLLQKPNQSPGSKAGGRLQCPRIAWTLHANGERLAIMAIPDRSKRTKSLESGEESLFMSKWGRQ